MLLAASVPERPCPFSDQMSPAPDVCPVTLIPVSVLGKEAIANLDHFNTKPERN